MNDLFSMAKTKYPQIRTWEDVPVQSLSAWRQELEKAESMLSGIVFKSSGTTGNGFRITYSNSVMEKASERARDVLMKTPIAPLDKIAIFFGYGLFPPASFYTTALVDMGCSVIPLGSGRNLPTDQKIEWFDKERISAIVSMPSYILRFSSELRNKRLLRKVQKSLKCIITGGEVLSTNLRNRIADIFNVPIYDHYGMLEAPMIAGDCEYGKMHICDGYYAEVKTSSGIQLDGRGNLLLSSSDVWGDNIPMIRVDTGDIVKLVSMEKCSCGNTNPFLRIYGRSDYRTKIRGRHVDLRAIFEKIDQLGVLEYQIIVDYDEALKERVRLDIDIDVFTDDTISKLQGLFPFPIQITSDTEFIAQSLDSGKVKRFIDLRYK